MDTQAIETLLRQAQLPTDGIERNPGNFIVATENAALVGAAGFEKCGKDSGLLRSVAVLPEYRKRGIARELYRRVALQARCSRISALYLLTTTAQGYFARLGFAETSRIDAPQAIKETRQFRVSCPASAIFMCRSIQ